MTNKPTKKLKDRVILMVGGTRGIGKAVAVRAGEDGAAVAILGKTDVEDERLPGTIHTAAAAVVEAGGRAIAIKCDIRFEDQIAEAIRQVIETFGHIDILVNNASNIWLAPTDKTPIKRLDLMLDINVRGTLISSALALPYLRQSDNGQILTLSPPISLKDKWFEEHPAYTLSKYGMSLITKGLAAQEQKYAKDHGTKPVRVTSIWPCTTIATAAVNMLGGDDLMLRSRTTKIMSDVIYWLMTRRGMKWNGKLLLDEPILKLMGITDLDPYAVDLSKVLKRDLYVDRPAPKANQVK